MNPRAATNDLLPFQGSPFSLLGISPKSVSQLFPIEKQPRRLFFKSCNAEGGIRTHAPLRTNGFQDRLVMTTSISLQAFSQTYFCILFHIPAFVKRFFQSFFFFCYILENTGSDTVSNMWFFLVFTGFSSFFYNMLPLT